MVRLRGAGARDRRRVIGSKSLSDIDSFTGESKKAEQALGGRGHEAAGFRDGPGSEAAN